MPQDNFLFAGTVRENVAFAAPDANDDQVRRACEAACAWDFVKELPLGLDTMIGEHGQGLSQGQLQRLAIARAVCSGAPAMVLDEVTSALDGKTEADVLANISRPAGKDGLRRRAPREGPRVRHNAPARGRRGCERGLRIQAVNNGLGHRAADAINREVLLSARKLSCGFGHCSCSLMALGIIGGRMKSPAGVIPAMVMSTDLACAYAIERAFFAK